MNNKEKISILIVNFNSSDFVILSLYALHKLTKNDYVVYVRDNGSINEDYLKLKKECDKYDNVFLDREETKLRGSLAHGTALNALVKKVRTKYVGILDADATWLVKNWDVYMIKKIRGQVGAVGTEADGSKPKDFPLMYAIVLETRTLNTLKVDFRPHKTNRLLDTGYDLREKYLNAGLRGIVIRGRNTRVYKKGSFKRVLGCVEYYMEGSGIICACHFGRGSSLGAQKYLKSWMRIIYKLPALGKLILRYQGQKESRKWLEICRKIIDSQ